MMDIRCHRETAVEPQGASASRIKDRTSPFQSCGPGASRLHRYQSSDIDLDTNSSERLVRAASCVGTRQGDAE